MKFFVISSKFCQIFVDFFDFLVTLYDFLTIFSDLQTYTPLSNNYRYTTFFRINWFKFEEKTVASLPKTSKLLRACQNCSTTFCRKSSYFKLKSIIFSNLHIQRLATVLNEISRKKRLYDFCRACFPRSIIPLMSEKIFLSILQDTMDF